MPVQGHGGWELPGAVPVHELERALGVALPRGHYATIAGPVISAAGPLPEPSTRLTVELPPDPGDLVHADDPAPRHLHVAVLAVERHVPSRVRLELPDRMRTDTTNHTGTATHTAGAGRAATTAEEDSR